MNPGNLCRRTLLLQLVTQQLLEHRVILVPLLLAVESNRKNAIRFKPTQGRLCFGQPNGCIADGHTRRRRDPFQYRRLHQESLHSLGQLGNDFCRQIVHRVVRTALQGSRQGSNTLLLAKIEPRQVEPRGPPLGALDEHIDRRVPHRLRQHSSHHLLCFRHGKAQVVGSDLDQAPVRAGTDQGQPRITARGDHQVQLPGRAPQQFGDQFMHRRLVNCLVVVQDENERPIHGGAGVGE